MNITPLSFPGCFVIHPKIVNDDRGTFFKPFINTEYEKVNLCTNFAEEYYTHSRKGVLRGMHFQLPPFEFVKLVNCLYGKVKDVIVDLRDGSPTYQNCEIILLDASDGKTLYLPPGIAHGFLTLSDIAIVVYKVTSGYAVDYDAGIRWDSLPVAWGMTNPILSTRDRSFPSMAEFISPFRYQPEKSTP